MSTTETRVAVIGLGTTGSMALWQLSQIPGVTAIGIEQFHLGHGYGSYTGESRLFRTAYHEGAQYVPMLLKARKMWEDLGAEVARPLFKPVGVLTVGHEAEDTFQNVVDSVNAHDLPHERLTAEQLRQRFPGLDFLDDESGIIDELGGALRPELAVLSAVQLAQENGAEIHENEKILHINDSGAEHDGVRITTSKREFTVDRVIVTAGSWAQLVLPELKDLLKVKRLVLTWFIPENAQNYTPDKLPCFIRDRNGFHVFGAPIIDGYSMKICGTVQWGDISGDPAESELRLDREQIHHFGEEVQKLFPEVSPEPCRYSVHYDSYTSNKTPIIDRPGAGNLVVVAGLSGHGFKFAPVFGEFAAQLATGQIPELYHPDFKVSAHSPFA